MKKANTLRLWPVLCAVLVLGACQKEASKSNEQTSVDQSVKASGAVPDDPSKVAKVPMIVSQDFLSHRLAVYALDASAASRGGAKPKPAGTTDATPPTVAISSPSNGSSVMGTITIQVTASDNVGVASVSVAIDNLTLGTLTAAPYNFNWNVTSGSHTIAATAKDAAGNASSTSIVVSNGTPIITITATNVPASFALNMPPVQSQGGEGACAVFSTTYAARSAEQYYRTNASSYDYATNIFSPEYVYDQTKIVDCGSGTGLTTALDFLMNNGVCTWQSMPYSSSNGCSLVPTAAQTAEAANYRIKSYSKLLSSDITTIKNLLVNKHPIIITINPDQAFWDATAGFIWRSYTGTPGISHNVVICGYDDAKHAYKIMNSWGTSWGDAGYSWIDYDFYPQTSYYYSYVIN